MLTRVFVVLEADGFVTYVMQDHDLEIMRKWDWRNILAKSLLSPLSLPVLPTWILTATQPLSHPQTLRGGTTADCTHFCPKEGGMFEMWSVFLFSIFRPLLKREAELEANPSLRSLPGTPIFWRTANAEIDRDRDSEIST